MSHDETPMRNAWTEAVAYAAGTLRWAFHGRLPDELTRLVDTAMRVHLVESVPTAQIAEDMESAWWATDIEWDWIWQDTDDCRHAYARWSEAFSVAYDLLTLWLDEHGRAAQEGADR